MKNSKITLVKSVFFGIIAFASLNGYSQMGIGTTSPTSKSVLDIRATDKGLLIPRLSTAQRTTFGTALTTAADVNNNGMQVFDTDTSSLWFWNGTGWYEVADKTRVATSYKPILDNTIANSASITAIGRYLVPATGLTNGFVGQANKYADYDGTSFTYTPAVLGDKVSILGGTNIGAVYTYSGSAWVKNSLTTPLPTDNYLVTNAYNSNDLVIKDSKIYQANAAVPANTTFVIGTSGATWKRISQVTQWAQASSYYAQDLVINNSILYQANADISANTSFTKGSSGATWKQVSGIPEWTNAGRIQDIGINGTTAFPIVSTNTTSNQILYKQTGPKTWKVRGIVVVPSSQVGGSGGTGDYLLNLPLNLSFDSSVPGQAFFTGNAGTASSIFLTKTIPSSSAFFINTGGNNYSRVLPGGVIPYDANRYRVYIPMDLGASLCWGSGWSQFGLHGVEVSWEFEFQSAN